MEHISSCGPKNVLVPNLLTVKIGAKRCDHVSSQGKAESSELVSPKTTDDIVPEKGAEEGRRRRHKTESVKQQWSQERAGAVELEQLQRCVPPPSQQLALTISVLIFSFFVPGLI